MRSSSIALCVCGLLAGSIVGRESPAGASPDEAGPLPEIFEKGARVSLVAPPPEMTIEEVRGHWIRISDTTWVHPASGIAWEQRAPGLVVRSMDNLMSITRLHLMEGPGVASWPSVSGKAFVLWHLAVGRIDRRAPGILEVFFSPGDALRRADRINPERWDEVTRNALLEGRLDLSSLTSYAGRRNGEKEHRLTSDDLSAGAPVLADLSFQDEGFVLVAFSNGRVQRMTRADLGLGPDDPIVVGDASRSPILRHLSDR